MEAAAMAQMKGDLEETGAKRRLDDSQEFQVEAAGAWVSKASGCRFRSEKVRGDFYHTFFSCATGSLLDPLL